jgi:hypothetical protein
VVQVANGCNNSLLPIPSQNGLFPPPPQVATSMTKAEINPPNCTLSVKCRIGETNSGLHVFHELPNLRCNKHMLQPRHQHLRSCCYTCIVREKREIHREKHIASLCYCIANTPCPTPGSCDENRTLQTSLSLCKQGKCHRGTWPSWKNSNL